MNKKSLYDGLSNNSILNKRSLVCEKENRINHNFHHDKSEQSMDYEILYVEEGNIGARFWNFDQSTNDCRFCIFENVSRGEVFFSGYYSELTSKMAAQFNNKLATALANEFIALFSKFQQPEQQ